MSIGEVSKFDGTTLIVAPHMDDEILACGGLLARMVDKDKSHVAYATDGMRSPAPVFPWQDAVTSDLGRIRMRESECATGILGIPAGNLHFLGLPEAELKRHVGSLREGLIKLIRELDPDHVVAPFRYDRHPDHLAVNRVVTALVQEDWCHASLTEYFVYYRWRLLPKRDIRKYIDPRCLFTVELNGVAEVKRSALACFESQTTRFYSWQTRPILTATLLDEECVGPEIFLNFDPALTGARVFTGAVPWIRLVHRLEPRLQKCKYLLKSALAQRTRREAVDV